MSYAELVALVRENVPCTCGHAYLDRDLIAPDCSWHHGGEVALEVLRDANALAGIMPRFFYAPEVWFSAAPAFGDTEHEQVLHAFLEQYRPQWLVTLDEQHAHTDEELAELRRYYLGGGGQP